MYPINARKKWLYRTSFVSIENNITQRNFGNKDDLRAFLREL